MKHVLAIFLFMFLAAQPTSAAGPSLWDDLINLTIQHVTKNGPDSDVAEFIDVAYQHASGRRTELVDLFVPYCDCCAGKSGCRGRGMGPALKGNSFRMPGT